MEIVAGEGEGGKGEGEGDETGVSETYNMSTYGRQTTVVIDELNLLNV